MKPLLKKRILPISFWALSPGLLKKKSKRPWFFNIKTISTSWRSISYKIILHGMNFNMIRVPYLQVTKQNDITYLIQALQDSCPQRVTLVSLYSSHWHFSLTFRERQIGHILGYVIQLCRAATTITETRRLPRAPKN